MDKNNLPTQRDVIEKEISSLEEEKKTVEQNLADINFMLRSLMNKLDKLEKKKGATNESKESD